MTRVKPGFMSIQPSPLILPDSSVPATYNCLVHPWINRKIYKSTHYENMPNDSNILKILPPKNENFQIKNSDIFHISAQSIDCGPR